MKISPVAFTNNCIGGGIHPTENSAAIIANYGSNRPTNFHGNPGVLCMIDMEEIRPFMYDDYNSKFRDDELAGTLTTNIGASSLRGGQKVCIPVLTPDRVEKRQNGRRMKENGDPSFTLTAQDIHGVALGVNMSNNSKQITEYDSVVISIDVESKDKDHPGLYIQLAEDFIIYAVWYEKYQCYITVRKLTPRECFRLQGWTDDYFDKAQFVNSDSQLYKQAGNGITVNVVEYIGNLLD